jgi:hypothetical protein
LTRHNKTYRLPRLPPHVGFPLQRLVPLPLEPRDPRQQRRLYPLPVAARDRVLRLQRLDLPQQLGLRVARGARRHLLGPHPHRLELALQHLQLGLELELPCLGALVGAFGLLAQLRRLRLAAVGDQVLFDLESGHFLLQVCDPPLVLLPGLLVRLDGQGVCLLGGFL